MQLPKWSSGGVVMNGVSMGHDWKNGVKDISSIVKNKDIFEKA